MSQDAATIARVRRMVNEPTTTPYTDEILTAYIEAHPVMDSMGHEQYDDDDVLDTEWTATYDLHWAAADVWEEKAAAVQTYYTFSADGGSYQQNQLYQTAMEQARFHASKRRPAHRKTRKSPVETETDGDLVYDGDVFAWRAN